MKKINTLQILITILLIFGTTAAKAQQQVFTKVFCDYNGSVTANAFLKTPDHHYLIGGSKDGSPAILKMDSLGNIVWCKKFGTNIGSFNAIIPGHDSCFIFGGNIIVTGNDYDMFIMKITGSGDSIWSKTIDFGGWDFAVSMDETYDHGNIITGFLVQNSGANYKIAVAKLDSSGNAAWTKTFFGAGQYNYPTTIKQTPDSGLILFGNTQTLSQYNPNTFLMKLTSNGEILWSKSTIFAPNSFAFALDVMCLDDGLLLNINPVNGFGMGLIKTDYSGNFVWGKQSSLYFLSNALFPGFRMKSTSDAGYVFMSNLEAGAEMMKTDSVGNFLWGKYLFLNAIDAVESDGGGYMVIGNGPIQYTSGTETANPQIGIIKTDSLGNSSDCVEPAYFENTDLTLEMQDISITPTTDGGTISDFYPLITDDDLSEYNGCVDVVGSVEENQPETPEISAFPNPSTGLIQIRLNHPETTNLANIEISNVLGEKVYESKNPPVFQSPIDLRSQPDGIYYIKCVFETTTFSGRVIIAH